MATVRRKKLEPEDLAVEEGAPETTQSSPETPQKTTQKTTQKTAQKLPRKLETTQKLPRKPKTTQKTTQKIYALIAEDPAVTRRQLAAVLGISSDGVKYHLRKLQEQGLLRRIGSDKGGHWKVETL